MNLNHNEKSKITCKGHFVNSKYIILNRHYIIKMKLPRLNKNFSVSIRFSYFIANILSGRYAGHRQRWCGGGGVAT